MFKEGGFGGVEEGGKLGDGEGDGIGRSKGGGQLGRSPLPPLLAGPPLLPSRAGDETPISSLTLDLVFVLAIGIAVTVTNAVTLTVARWRRAWWW